MLTTNDIRRKFLSYFQSQGHEPVRSSSLVPKDDPSLLFTNAGMVQFKKIFQGQEKRAYSRAVTDQKCLRLGGKHNDLENVGRTARHHTFFEMMGNFSFGDYFKEDAIKFAWHFVTKELGLPAEKLYATVFLDDDEAVDLWLKHTSIPAERILRMGEKDNFWSMGDTGPCGPCSEILIDQGEHMTCGPNCGIGKCDCDRFLEIWNLVFMQYNQIEPGRREPLPRPSIDTGMGLERVSAVCQGVYSNYDTDLFRSIIDFAASLAGVTYSRSMPDTNDIDTALRVIADHSRATAFMIADGIMPSNEGRGYMLRRLIRRAYRFGRFIGMPSTFMHLTANQVVDSMEADFPELGGARTMITRIIREEEQRFEKTLDKGLILLEEGLAELTAQGKNIIDGGMAFKLYDTFGFPMDIVNDVAEKRGFKLDEAGFNAHMKEQKERAKAAWKGSGEVDPAARFAALLEEGLRSEFVGYASLTAHSRLTALLDEKGNRVPGLTAGATGWLACGQTPFYGASGGQAGDLGEIITASGQGEILETVKAGPNLTMHQVRVNSGELLLDQEADLSVHDGGRKASARNHTCTHLLHSALRSVLGDHVRQAGSLVTPDRLRFDFTHIAAMSEEELAAVENHVNRAIMADRAVGAQECSYDEALATGAMALFGEKYGDVVRLVNIDGESMELCGGTHLERTGEAGLFAILSESGIAAGTRRIEAVTGWNALELLRGQRDQIKDASALLKARPDELTDKIQGLLTETRSLRKDLEKAEAVSASQQGQSLMDQLREVAGVKVLAVRTAAQNIKALRDLADDLRSKLPSGIVCLTAEEEGKVNMIIGVSKDLHGRFTAPALIKEVAAKIGGSGGGRPDLAQAGGTDASGIEAAFALLYELVGR
ncbi:MAG: alanine--tRNA ligase [Deltaproteobacteria bacterium]|jgi:alanyl-tRNA synthetase|nr:alanine--tRNA ligase [Deltaproteobacteria bacterium]